MEILFNTDELYKELEDYGIDYDDYINQLNSLEHGSEINILLNKELYAVAIVDNQVAGALYTDYSNDEFSFDIIIDPKYRKRGIGTALLDIALDEYDFLENELGAAISVDVVNPVMKHMLEKRGFRVVDEYPNRWIMEKDTL